VVLQCRSADRRAELDEELGYRGLGKGRCLWDWRRCIFGFVLDHSNLRNAVEHLQKAAVSSNTFLEGALLIAFLQKKVAERNARIMDLTRSMSKLKAVFEESGV